MKHTKTISGGIAIATLLASTLANAGALAKDEFNSPVLGRKVPMNVYLPDGYQKGGQYPVIYLLHGAGGNETEWASNGNIVQVLDGMIRRGEIRPTVAVMPTTGGGTWWVNGAADKAETAFMQELVPYVQRKYKVATDRSSRSIGGQSMGGYGALHMALKFPDKFCGAAILSPAIYDPVPPPTSASRNTAQFMRDGKFDDALWKSLNYPPLLNAYRQGSARVPMWIASGDHDHLGIVVESANLYWNLYKFQPGQVEFRVIDGDHEWPVFNAVFPDAMRYVDTQCVRGLSPDR